MARLPRLTIPSRPHLVLQRSAGGQPAFVDEEDRRAFLAVLSSVSRERGVALHAFGLRNGEFRLLLTPSDASGLGRMMQALGRRFVASFNRRHGRRGTLWEGRFRATVIDPSAVLIDATRWVEAVEDEPAVVLDQTRSSAAHHLGSQPMPFIVEHPEYWRLGNTPFEREAAYRRLWEEPLAAEWQERIAKSVEAGWPLGSAAFLESLAGETARRLAPRPRGRPAKKVVPNL